MNDGVGTRTPCACTRDRRCSNQDAPRASFLDGSLLLTVGDSGFLECGLVPATLVVGESDVGDSMPSSSLSCASERRARSILSFTHTT